RRSSDDKNNVRRDLILVGLALTSYKLEKREYPASLDDLKPNHLDAVPLDSFTDRPLDYRREAEGRARLASLGANRVDDSGKPYNDDLIVKLP
ncbi:MAG: hypothetical protein ACRDD1_09405, partial [Planctomycetia bacterium]